MKVFFWLLYLLENFLLQHKLVFLNWRLRDNKFPQVFRILLSCNNSVVWMVWILPLIPNSSSFSSKTFRTVLSVLITIFITVTHTFYYYFLIFCQGRNICLCFCFLLFALCSPPNRQHATDGKYSLIIIIIIIIIIIVPWEFSHQC